MADLITTLKKKGDTSTNVYPNVKSDNIPNNAITTVKINDGAVTNAKIYDGAVTSGKLASNSVTTGKLASNSVTTAKINDGAVTITKISDGAVTSQKIALNTITNSHIANNTISAEKLAFGLYTHLLTLMIEPSPSNEIYLHIDIISTDSDGYNTLNDFDSWFYDKYGSETLKGVAYVQSTTYTKPFLIKSNGIDYDVFIGEDTYNNIQIGSITDAVIPIL